MNKISALIKETPQRSLDLSAMGGYRENMPTVTQEEDTHRTVNLLAP